MLSIPDLIMFVVRQRRQAKVLAWAVSTFGSIAKEPEERINRFLEESLELVQALNFSKERVMCLVEYVYSRPPGETFQEVGGVSLTLLALCQSLGLSADEAEAMEILRVLSADRSKFRDKQNRKAEAGVGGQVSNDRMYP